jgi:FAD:protein FMN transferase
MAILTRHGPMGPSTATSLPGEIRVEGRGEGLIAACFNAMASPCELLLAESERRDAMVLAAIVAEEAWRVERKYSRYRSDSAVSIINQSRGGQMVLDDETVSMIDYAQHCFEISSGMFDITSGILRTAWQFDQSDRLPQSAVIEELLPLIGFDKLQWHRPVLMMPHKMELDFGGFGKEYAVDRAYALLAGQYHGVFLINFGGDLRANRAPPKGVWRVGVERPGAHGDASVMLELEYGALATSGDSHRYLMKNGVRYGHILDPHTGWPVEGAPRSVTVAASSCTEAGLLATMASLKGAQAEEFLKEAGARYWMNR